MKKCYIVFVLILSIVAVSNAQYSSDPIYYIDSCDFENPILEQISIDSAIDNLFLIARPSKSYFSEAHSFDKAVLTDSSNFYPINNHSSFIYKFDFQDRPISGNFAVQFWHKYDTDTLTDRCYVELSTDFGMNWVDVSDANEVAVYENFYLPTDSSSPYFGGFSGRSDGWERSGFQWVWAWPLRYLGQPENHIWIRFSFESDSIHNDKEGWMIDNLDFFVQNFGSGVLPTDLPPPGLNIFPNPAKDIININLDSSSSDIITLQVIDISGKIIEQKTFSESFQLSTHQWALGNYYLNFMKGNHRIGSEIISVVR